MRPETEYFLMRASEETRRALTAEVPQVSEAHETMAVRYSAKAVALLDEEDRDAGNASVVPRQGTC